MSTPISIANVTATVTTLDDEITSRDGRDGAADKIASFMSRVVPWPQGGECAFINLHWTSPKGQGMRGRPYTSPVELLSMAQWGATKPAVMKDIYFCLSSQSATGPVYKGRATAARSQQSVIAVKAIWLDVDVKPGKGYPTLTAALNAITEFVVKANLPSVSALVFSGGGVHVYWISDRPLGRSEWQAYADGLKALGVAHGLKFDEGVTIDSARILRVPGTFNYKTTPPKEVRLDALGADYDFETVLAHVRAAATPVVTAAVTKTQVPFDLSKFPKKPITPGKLESLAEGIKTFEESPLDPIGVFRGCPFFLDAAKTHGAQHDQPLWHLAVLSCTFWQDGRPWAHYMSKGHSKYMKKETDAMFDRKERERKQQRGLGWPSCKAIEDSGCKLCTTCVHKGKIKSPLNLAVPWQAPAAEPSQEAPPAPPSFVDPYAEFAGPEFPLDVLPPTLRKFVDAEYRAMGADPSAIAMAALTTVAGAMHAETVIRAGEGWWERPILWTALVGQPSTMKSPIIEKAKKPLSNIDQERNKRWRQEYAIWQQQNRK
jgi:hypothetical protein